MAPMMAGDQRQVDQSAQAQRLGGGCGFGLAAREPEVEREENRQHQHGDDGRLIGEMRGGPEEIDAAQEADEQRRIAERRQRAADIGDQEDEEDHHVGVVRARRVGADQRPHQDHGGAGGADQLAIAVPSSRMPALTTACRARCR